jgi:flagella synthesis protein FlgN
MITPALDVLERALERFVDILDGESNALGKADMAALRDSLADKERMAGEVAHAWTEALAWLRGQSNTSLNQGLDVPAEIMPRWQAIVALAKRAEGLNQGNGRMIEAQLSRARGALDVLQAASRPVNLYGADGHMLNLPTQGHTLDKV